MGVLGGLRVLWQDAAHGGIVGHCDDGRFAGWREREKRPGQMPKPGGVERGRGSRAVDMKPMQWASGLPGSGRETAMDERRAVVVFDGGGGGERAGATVAIADVCVSTWAHGRRRAALHWTGMGHLGGLRTGAMLQLPSLLHREGRLFLGPGIRRGWLQWFPQTDWRMMERGEGLAHVLGRRRGRGWTSGPGLIISADVLGARDDGV